MAILKLVNVARLVAVVQLAYVFMFASYVLALLVTFETFVVAAGCVADVFAAITDVADTKNVTINVSENKARRSDNGYADCLNKFFMKNTRLNR
jgi:hypothetical protein